MLLRPSCECRASRRLGQDGHAIYEGLLETGCKQKVVGYMSAQQYEKKHTSSWRRGTRGPTIRICSSQPRRVSNVETMCWLSGLDIKGLRQHNGIQLPANASVAERLPTAARASYTDVRPITIKFYALISTLQICL